MDNIQKTIHYLKNAFEESAYLNDKPHEKAYRLEHTFRVASIGKIIAEKENLDVEATIIGCLLHDNSYIHEMKTDQERHNHGRKSVEICRLFVMGLTMDEHLKHELLYGIAIHVDDQSDFEGERTTLAETIGEADNIDRFDRYRLYEGLLYSGLDTMTLDGKKAYVSKTIERLKKMKTHTFKTRTSTRMWHEKLDVQIEYLCGLLEQLKSTDPNESLQAGMTWQAKACSFLLSCR